MSAALRLTVATVALASLAVAGVTPAYAAPRTLPATDDMFSIACDDGYANMQLFGVDAATAASTEIGTGDATVACASQPAWDVTTSTAYYVMFDFPMSILATIDTTSGATTTIGYFTDTVAEPDESPFVQAIAIGLDGAAYAFTDDYFYSVDLATGNLTPLGAVATEILGFSVDPTSGLFYAADTSGNVYSVDVTDGTLQIVGSANFGSDFEVYSLQIDSAGTFWYASYDDALDELQLWSTASGIAGSEELSGVFEVDGNEYFHEALLVTRTVEAPAAPVLANTGADTTSTLIIGAGALGLLILGAGLFVARRRTL